MRALLVANPTATTTTTRTRDVIARALSSTYDLDVVLTEHRGHARDLARRARAEGLDLVVALGGDGTVNEVVNGLLGAAPAPGAPALGVVPGGSTNVFARALGVAQDPVEATGQLLDAVAAGRLRRVGLARAGERWFTFSAGLGLDAEVVGAVDRRRGAGARSTPGLFLRTAVRQFYLGTERRHGPLTLVRPGQPDVEGLFLAVVQNTAPWTYLGTRRIDPSPRASFDTGLDLYALRSLRSATVLREAAALLRGTGRTGASVLQLHDEPELVLRSQVPVALQIDGEHLGTRTSLTFTAVPGALAVRV
ncbi:diacylglycerol/lipid kinase family protein [Vallicoccus soli]|uniref:Diacylglycerol kinase family lipid kinase n=1 Tax=Vallicoccus soli TaxID=2339232 RepID=A0A3A3ZIX7_9ACTN|nr:diacylglycerol kinase family protein [Vallicoccus soli]RJK95432.1 diacylglycerol kinase family lipid kinase [Vallicoccus soli]